MNKFGNMATMPLPKDVSFGGPQSFGPPSTQAARTNQLEGSMSAFHASSFGQIAYTTTMNGGRPSSVTPRGTRIPLNSSNQAAVVTPVVTTTVGNNAIQTPTPKHAAPNVVGGIVEAAAEGGSHKDSQPSQSAFKPHKKINAPAGKTSASALAAEQEVRQKQSCENQGVIKITENEKSSKSAEPLNNSRSIPENTSMAD